MPFAIRLALVALLALSGAASADPVLPESRAATLQHVLAVLQAAPQTEGGCSHPLCWAPLLCRANVALTQMATARL